MIVLGHSSSPSSNMVPPLKPCKISEVLPTEDEEKVARQHLAGLSKAQLRSKKASLMHFLKTNPDVTAAGAKGMVGDIMLGKFHVHTLRCKDTTKNQESSREIGKKRKLMHTLNWMSIEAMRSKYGQDKANHWADSGLLPIRPDRVTKSMEWNHLEYGCAEDWEEYSESDLRKLKHTVEAELAEEDAEALNDLSATIFGAAQLSSSSAPSGSGQASGDASGLPTETPKKTDEEKFADDMDKLMNNIQKTLRKYQDQQTAIEIMHTKVQTSPSAEMVSSFLATFKASLTSALTSLGKLVPALKKLVLVPDGMKVNQAQAKKVLTSMKKCDATFAEIEEYAPKFGCEVTPKKEKKKRKRADE